MVAYIEDEECDEAVEETNHHSRLHRENRDFLRDRFGTVAVDQAKKAMKMILDNSHTHTPF